MGACGKYLKNQFQLNMFSLEYHDETKFYISCWQKSNSALPLLIWRGLLFLVSLGIVLTSISHLGLNGVGRLWPIYLTHWGVFFIMLTTGFSFAVSARYYFGTLTDVLYLPWDIKAYWALYNATIPLAFMITIFYYTFLANGSEEYAPNKVLDALVHALNSVIMILELAASAHPSRLLHFYHSLLLGLAYVIFGVIYYLAGGLDLFGNHYIYPMIDWSKPGMTILVVLLTTVLILLMHLFTVALAAMRDIVAKRCIVRQNSSTIADF